MEAKSCCRIRDEHGSVFGTFTGFVTSKNLVGEGFFEGFGWDRWSDPRSVVSLRRCALEEGSLRKEMR